MRNRSPRRSRSTAASGGRPRAFTLLEILVALAVLSIALVTLYQSFASTVHVNTATRGLWRAIVWVNGELARLERGPVPSVSVQQGRYQGDHPMVGYTWEQQVADEQPFPGVTVRKVTMEVRWDAAGVPQSYRSQIYVRPN